MRQASEDALLFQDALEAIIAAPAPRALRRTSSVFAGMLAALLTAAALTRVDVVVSGQGTLAADHPTAILQAMDRAMIRTLRVRAGDRVRRGDVLATLDPTFAQADLRALLAQRRTLAAEIDRLSAEAVGAAYRAGPRASAEEILQASLAAQRRNAYAARLNSFDQALAHMRAQEETARGQQSAGAIQSRIYTAIRGLRRDLFQGAVGSRLQYLESQAEAARADAAASDAGGRLNEVIRSEQAIEADRDSFIQDWRRTVVETLAERRAAFVQSEAGLAKAERMQDLADVRAPEDGIVLSVAPRAPGSVLGPDQPLLVLLPTRAALTAELTVRSADIGYLRPGDPVEVKVDAFRYERHGALHGHVRSVSEASEQAGPSAGAVHRVDVDLDGPGLINLPPGTGPMPGMTVTGDVRVGSRSVLAYFLAPITRGFAQSLREP